MKTCKTCPDRDSCRELCPDIAARLPKDSTGTGRLVYLDDENAIEAASRTNGSPWASVVYHEAERAVDALPLRQRAIVILIARDFSYTDVAKLLNTTTHAIVEAYRRARVNLRPK